MTSPVKTTWQWEHLLAAEAPEDAPLVEVLDALLRGYHGLDAADLSAEQLAKLEGELHYMPLRSVVKADLDDLGMYPGEWHTDGSGKRVRDAWWIDSVVFDDIAEAVAEAKEQAAGQ